MSEINFRRYREYVSARVGANNAMIALLAGSRLAAHNLQLHSGSPYQLPGLFPAVADIDRFNLLPDQASALLLNADSHLSAVAIPYALAVYEAFVKDAAELLKRDGIAITIDRKTMAAGAMHNTFYKAAGVPQPLRIVNLFHVLRAARNAQIHNAGVLTSEVTQTIANLTADQQSRWEKLTMAPIGAMINGDHLEFTIGHLVAAFAVTKEAARHINATLGTVLSRKLWAELAIEDYLPTATHPRNSLNWRKSLVGYTRFNYLGGLNLLTQELEAAARSTGVWNHHQW